MLRVLAKFENVTLENLGGFMMMMITVFIKYHVLAIAVRGPLVWFPWAIWWGCGFLLPTLPWCLPAASLGGGCLFQASGGALCFVQDPPASFQAQTQFTDAVGFQSRREAGWTLLFPWIESKKLNKGWRAPVWKSNHLGPQLTEFLSSWHCALCSLGSKLFNVHPLPSPY